MAVVGFAWAFTLTGFTLVAVAVARRGAAVVNAGFVTLGGGAGSGEATGAGSGVGVGAVAVDSAVDVAELVAIVVLLGGGSSLLEASAGSNPPAATAQVIPSAATRTNMQGLQALPHRSSGDLRNKVNDSPRRPL